MYVYICALGYTFAIRLSASAQKYATFYSEWHVHPVCMRLHYSLQIFILFFCERVHSIRSHHVLWLYLFFTANIHIYEYNENVSFLFRFSTLLFFSFICIPFCTALSFRISADCVTLTEKYKAKIKKRDFECTKIVDAPIKESPRANVKRVGGAGSAKRRWMRI